ncbi:sugar transferase [Caulobacter sp. KR2-114]|uniref:sugar transferase n=1 Tax=Caulobacter sp. KR2-114 TaxID=3400912 RepID=UPI003C119F50
MKRAFDIVFAAAVLTVASPVLLTAMGLVWLQDRHSPLYLARRVGRNGADFQMVKIRSMVVDADCSGVNSTSAGDNRVTPVGRWIRRCKLDEVSQFWNVLVGEMSVVGPRPNTRAWGVDLYTAEEQRLLSVRPGITDLASIVFADEGDILQGAENADLTYNQLIRPWKSRLGLLYVERIGRAGGAAVWLDLRIAWLTALAIVSRPAALKGVEGILRELGADEALIAVCRRQGAKPPAGAPPGADRIFFLEGAGQA